MLRKPKLLHQQSSQLSNRSQLWLIDDTDDDEDVDIDLQIGYRRRELSDLQDYDNEDLSDFVLDRLKTARETALAVYREQWA